MEYNNNADYIQQGSVNNEIIEMGDTLEKAMKTIQNFTQSCLLNEMQKK